MDKSKNNFVILLKYFLMFPDFHNEFTRFQKLRYTWETKKKRGVKFQPLNLKTWREINWR